ncbi:uracil phosphoribosyltransferase [Sclerotinia borealis F-4128]|uniref:Uracil phosphoribosyltransferase n=1 Tax=Sclerotinia borealis (strain F-4128) TaxID=1432307 RepID=W9CBE7_SCLBF|nr:uracil phosphoribosyltransferase [Sclerotinia borealis F-4128]
MAGQTEDSLYTPGPSNSHKKSTVIGIYGISGCGKSYILKQMRKEFENEKGFIFYEGSEVIDECTPGGLEAFKTMGTELQKHYQKTAIQKIGDQSTELGCVAIVAGHFMFWEEGGTNQPVLVWNSADAEVYTHIIYLKVPAAIVQQNRLKDKERKRSQASVQHLNKWQEKEMFGLRETCYQNAILITCVGALDQVSKLVLNFRHDSESNNLVLANTMLTRQVLSADAEQDWPETMLVMDGDRTLVAEDTGALFWQIWIARHKSDAAEYQDPLRTLFSSKLGYSYTAFRQAALIYEELTDDAEFDDICQEVASIVNIHPEFVSLLQSVAKEKHIGSVIISCGLRRVWEKILEKEGLSKSVRVIGGGRVADGNYGIVVTAEVKAALVKRLRENPKTYVWAFGDSVLDLGMLKAANKAIVVVGEVHKRSKKVEAELLKAIDNDGLRASQVMLPENESPRLNTEKLPLIKLTDQKFLEAIFHHEGRSGKLPVFDATNKNAAKLLMTPTRDATNQGPALRDHHRSIGRYLAIEFMSEVIGVESFDIPHVQGHQTSGHRLLHESQTLIVALMRGGEPMALGINDAFPLAMFLHAHDPEDVMAKHLQGQSTIVLVDSVINNGKTITDFVQHIRKLNAIVRIVIVAGVVQAQSIAEGTGILASTLVQHGNCSIVALRISDNKFTGKGVTDTGDRLFNTTHLI